MTRKTVGGESWTGTGLTTRDQLDSTRVSNGKPGSAVRVRELFSQCTSQPTTERRSMEANEFMPHCADNEEGDRERR